jgi:glycosyltransferase involved in cell wall biosynthesis
MKLLVVLYKFGAPHEIGRQLGSFAYFYSQLTYLAEANIEIEVLAPWLTYFHKGSAHYGKITVTRYWPPLISKRLRTLFFYRLSNKLYIWQTQRLVGRLAPQFDAVYVRQARETGYAAARVRQKQNFPFIFQPITTWQWHFKDTNMQKYQGPKNQIKRFLKILIQDINNQIKYAATILNRADKIITYNKAMAQEYISLGAKQDKFSIVPGAVNHHLFKPLQDKHKLRQKLKLPAKHSLVIYIGRMNIAEKGLDYLLAAVKQIKRPLNLVLIGPGTPKQQHQLKTLIEKNGLQEQAHYLGPKPYAELPGYINASDCAVQPSVWFEAFGRVALDILACGLPLINTQVGGLSEMNLHGVTGLTVPPRDATALAQAIEKLITNENLRKKLGQNARQMVLEKYTFAAVSKRLIEALQNALP